MADRGRREWVGRAVDGVMTYWLSGMGGPEHQEMADWWTSDDAADSALEIVYCVRDAIERAGWEIVKRESDG